MATSANPFHTPTPKEQATNLSHHAVPFITEGVGVFILVFSQAWVGRIQATTSDVGATTTMAPITTSEQPELGETSLDHAELVWALTAFAFMVIGLIYALEPVSGAHLNPAFTLCDFMAKKTSGKRALGYMASHIIGAILAGRLVAFMGLVPAEGYDGFSHGFSHIIPELLYTSMLCFVMMNATCEEATRGNEFYGLAIGMVYVAGGIAVGSISEFNPALTIGRFMADLSLDSLWLCLALVAAQCVGGMLANKLYRVCRPNEYNPDQGEFTTKAAGEFIGTFFIALTLCLNTVTRSVAASWSMAAALMSATYSLATVASGANLNPSVTLGLLLSGRDKIDPGDGRLYIIVQVIAGLCAGLVAGLFARAAHHFEVIEGPGNPLLSPVSNALTDFLFTSLLVFTWLVMLTTGSDTQSFFGLAIASCVTASAVAALNPAVILGAVVAVTVQASSFGTFGWLQALLLLGTELAGGVAGSGAFRLLYRREFDGHYLERMLHMSENPMGMQVGSQVAGNERQSAWKEQVADFKNRACTVCNY